MNDDYVSFHFQIKYHTNFGQNIYIFGDCQDFGDWSPTFKLNYTENNDIWSGDYKLPKKSNCIEFKFVCHNDSNNENIYEGGANRLLDPNNLDGLSKTLDGKYILDCQWKYFKINFNLIYRIKESNKNMNVKIEGKLYKMEYQKEKIIKTKDGKEINEFWTVTIPLESHQTNFLDYQYQYLLFEEGQNNNLLNKEPERHLHIILKKEDKNNHNNNGHNYLLTNSYLQIIDTIENESPSSSSSEFKFHQIGNKNLYLGPYPNSDLDLKSLKEKGINLIINFVSDQDAEKEEYKNMAKVSFYKIENSQLSSLAIKEGQVIYITDTKRLYLDSAANTRIELASYNLTQDVSDNHVLTFTKPDGTTNTYTIPDCYFDFELREAGELW